MRLLCAVLQVSRSGLLVCARWRRPGSARSGVNRSGPAPSSGLPWHVWLPTPVCGLAASRVSRGPAFHPDADAPGAPATSASAPPSAHHGQSAPPIAPNLLNCQFALCVNLTLIGCGGGIARLSGPRTGGCILRLWLICFPAKWWAGPVRRRWSHA